MNTRSLYAFIFLLPALLSQAYAQNFVKVYNQPFGIGQVVSEDPDGYTIATLDRDINIDSIQNFHLFKVNKNGKIISQAVVGDLSIPYRDFQNPRSPVIIKTKDSGYIILEADSSNHRGIKLLKLDYSGNVLWNKTIDTSNTYALSYQVFSFIEGKDKSFYLLTKDDENDLLIKTDSTGNIIYRNEFPGLSSTNGRRALSEFSDGTLIAGAKNKLFWLDQNGHILKESEPLSYDIGLILMEQNDEIIIAATGSELEKFDREGNSIWKGQSAHQIYTIKNTKDRGFITIQGIFYGTQYLSKLDEFGNTEWIIELDGNMKDVIETTDNGYAMTGSYWFYHSNTQKYWILPMIQKTNSIGNYQGVSLIFPPNSVSAASTQAVGWLSEGVNAVDLEYSTNRGGTWKELAKSIPADQKYSPWEVPFELSDNCLMKISASENSSFTDQSDSLFAITPPYMKYEYIAANEIKMWVGNRGEGSHDPFTDLAGYFWPGGNNASLTAIFQDGLVWGGKINGQIRTGGSTYRSGLQPGNILVKEGRALPDDKMFQVWRIKKDWESLPEGSEKNRYQYYAEHWPVQTGIPWVDENRDGIYTAGIDQPKYYGDEMLFNTANDFDTATSNFLYGSDPMGIEMQCLTFGKDTPDLKDAVFKKYKIINRGNEAITDMYLSYWTDDDLGDANDDYCGVDSSLGMGYSWNGTNNDQRYGSPPPAVAHMIVQGPAVPAALNDSARFDDSWRRGYKNLPATSFVFYIGGGSIYSDPDLGRYEGSLMMYNNMQGLGWNGSLYIDPNTGESVKYLLAGDPVSGTGWYEGNGWPNGPWYGDRRNMISSGPFNLAPGDTQEITIAIFMGLGSNNINSISALREKSAAIKYYYNNELVEEQKSTPPPQLTNYYLEQNYPNPFNSSTMIEYRIPEKSNVTIKIFDILGREVKTINQGEQVPWHYTVSFNASSLASGVYFYRITAVPVNSAAGEFIQTKKMILLK